MGTQTRRRILSKKRLAVLLILAVYIYYASTLKALRSLSNKKDAVSYQDKLVDATDSGETKEQDNGNEERVLLWKNSIHIVVVSCGDRLEESLVMLKSTVLFSRSHLIFHIFTEPDHIKAFQEQLDVWPPPYRKKIDYIIHNVTFPSTNEIKAGDWKKLYKPCASQRLFLPDLLTYVDAVLYLDTDVLFLSPVDEMWKFFQRFNSTQLIALANDNDDESTAWYNKFAEHPYYGVTGVNSGIMLMNLTKLRASSWSQFMLEYYKEYKLKIPYGDQDLINIYFHYHPEQLYLIPCEINYHPRLCMNKSVCQPAERTGAYILHGYERNWFVDEQPAFKAVYTAFKEHYLGGSIKYDLLISINYHLKKANPSNCGEIPQLFTKQIEEYIINSELNLMIPENNKTYKS